MFPLGSKSNGQTKTDPDAAEASRPAPKHFPTPLHYALQRNSPVMLLPRFPRWLRFQVERFLLRGTPYRLLLICVAIGLLSTLAGLLLQWGEPGEHDFANTVWWAFLRLTDPGYLGDDEGSVRRTISTGLTVAGYVLFMGALVATMTQGLNDQLRRLEQGFTPVAMKNHIVVIGWNASTPELLAELTEPSHGLVRFFETYGVRGLRIAVLAEEVGPHMEQALRERLGKRYRPSATVFRSGSPLQEAHLERVDYRNAAVIVFSMPEHGRDFDEASDDAHLAKAVVTLSRALKNSKHTPTVVAPVVDPHKLEIIRSIYPRGHAQLFATAYVMGRMLVRFIRHQGTLQVMAEILSQEYGSELYAHRLPELEGQKFSDLLWTYDRAIVLGSVDITGATPIVNLCPSLDQTIPKNSSLLVLAEDGDLPKSKLGPPPKLSIGEKLQPASGVGGSLVLLGWNDSVPWMLHALQNSQESWTVLIAAFVSTEDRERALRTAEITLDRVHIEHRVCDVTAPGELRRLPIREYETVVVTASDQLESAEDADARSLLVYQLLRAQSNTVGYPEQRILVELRDPSNAALFDDSDTEALASSTLVTHMLAQIALRPELRCALEALLSHGGPEFDFVAPELLGVTAVPTRFADLQVKGAERGAVTLGLRLARQQSNGGVILNPPRGAEFVLTSEDRVIVMRKGVDNEGRSSLLAPPPSVG